VDTQSDHPIASLRLTRFGDDVTGLVTLALLYMTVLSVLGRRKLPGGMDSVALPFAGLFALPSVRSVMPGQPPFGVLFPSSPSHFVLTLTFRLFHRYDN
jgi:hypothetical protein